MARPRRQNDDDTPGQPIGNGGQDDGGNVAEVDPLGTTQPEGVDAESPWHPSDEDEAEAHDDAEQEG